jgi:hypothetical protein
MIFTIRRLQLVIIVIIVVLITATISHSVVSWLKIKTSFMIHWATGPGSGHDSVLVAGSSLSRDGLSWKLIGDSLNINFEGWGVAGSSPSEWEFSNHQDVETKFRILVISYYDLNEYYLSDFRAEIVPLRQTIKDLWLSRSGWLFSKRVLSQYPLSYSRIIFPTVGRSDGVMVGLREKIKQLASFLLIRDGEEDPKLSLSENAFTQENREEKISNWSQGRIMRRIAGLRNACQGKHAFNGPKRMAFMRMLYQAQRQGKVVVVVLPVSPVYLKEIISLQEKRKFEEVLIEVKRKAPKAYWIRLDQLDYLNSNEYFWDLVHLNKYGQIIATNAFLNQMNLLLNIL